MVKGRQYDQEVIVVCVRRYLSFKLSSRDLVEITSERGITLAHTHDSALGAAVRARIREAMEALCSTGWRFVAL